MRRGQRGGVVHAIAHHGDDMATFAQGGHARRLLPRQHLGHHLVFTQAQSLAHGQRRGAVVARDHHQTQTPRTQGRESLGRLRFGLVSEGHQRARSQALCGALHHHRQGGALLLQARHVTRQRRQVHPQRLHPAQASDAVAAQAHLALGALAGYRTHSLGRRHGQPLRVRRGLDRAGQWMLAAALQAGGDDQLLGRVAPGCRDKGHESRLAHGERAGLVESHGVHAVRDLQGLGILDQDAVPRRDAGAGHDRRGRGQAQRAGTGDHHHRHRMDQGQLHGRTRDQPARESDHGDHEHHRHEHRRHLVHQALDRRLGCLRVFHQANDLRQHRLAAHSLRLHHEAAFGVDAAAGHARAHSLGHWERLAGQHGLVDMGLPLFDDAVGRHALAGSHHESIPGQHFGQRQVGLGAVGLHHMRHLGPQGLQCADGGGGLVLGAGLQPLAQKHKGDHHRRGLEIQVLRVAGQPQPHRQAPPRRGSQGHEQVHVAGARAQRVPARPVEARTEDELHRRGQRGLQPRRQHPMTPQQPGHHRHHQGQRQRDRPGHRQETRPGRGWYGGGVFTRSGFIARIAHRTADLRLRLLAGGVDDAGGFGGEVDRGRLHARHPLQRPLDPAHARGAGHTAHTQVQRGGDGFSGGGHLGHLDILGSGIML